MNKLEDRDYIFNINLMLIRIEYYTKGLTETEFYNDPKVRDAVSFCIMNLGYAISKLSDNIRNEYIKDSLSFFTIFQKLGTFGDEELWEMLKDKENGLLNHSKRIKEMYDYECNEKKKPNQIIKSKIEFTTDYKYPIKTSSSIWTVKKNKIVV